MTAQAYLDVERDRLEGESQAQAESEPVLLTHEPDIVLPSQPAASIQPTHKTRSKGPRH